jgi:serine/threonine-protein kinase RsbW
MAAALTQSVLDAAARQDGELRSALIAGSSAPGRYATHVKVFPGTADQVRQARNFVRAAFADHAAQHDAVLVASELAANAIMHSASGHADGLFLVHLTEINADYVGVIVTDQGGPNPIEVYASVPDAHNGCGLCIVASVAALCVTTGSDATRSVLVVIPAATARDSKD